MFVVLTAEEVEELRSLYAELPAAVARAGAAIRTRGHPMEGEYLRRFLEADQEVGRINDRISEVTSRT